MPGKELFFEGIPVEVQKKRGNRNIYLRVRRDGSLLVTAPLRTSDRIIRSFLSDRKEWIERTKQKVEQRYQPDPPDVFRLWGEWIPLAVLPAGRSRVRFEGTSLTVFCPDPEDTASVEKLLRNWSSRELKSRLPDLISECEQITGKRPSSITVRDMVSRWGSCNPHTASITLNLRLLRHDPACLRYVLIHELVHLYEPSHNRRFQDLMTRFCPGWRELRKQLRSEPF